MRLLASSALCLLLTVTSALRANAPRPLFFVLPDQSQVRLEAQPPLSEKKVSTLSLHPSAESPWVPIAFDAEMPAHKHGMVLKPTAPQRTGDRYELKGVKLHMSGAWLLKLQVRHQKSGEEKWVETPLLLKP